MAGESDKPGAGAPKAAANPASPGAPAPAGAAGPAADSNPATDKLGQVDQQTADDFAPRQRRAAQQAPSTTLLPGQGAGGAGLGAALHPDDQVPRERGKPGEQGKPLAAESLGRYMFNVTVHAPGPDHVPFKFEGNSNVVSDGHFQAHEYPPGAVVVMERREGDRLLARFGGRRLAEDENPPGQPDVVLNDRGPEGPNAAEAQRKREEADAGAAQTQAHQANG